MSDDTSSQLPYCASKPFDFFTHPDIECLEWAPELARIWEVRDILAATTQDVARILLWTIASGVHPDLGSGSVQIGEELLPPACVEATKAVSYALARMTARTHEVRDDNWRGIAYRDVAYTLFEAGYRAYHVIERNQNLWDGPSSVYKYSEAHQLLVRCHDTDVAVWAEPVVKVPNQSFDASNPQHTTYRLSSLQMVCDLTEFLEELRDLNPRFAPDPAAVFDALEHITMRCCHNSN